MYLLTTLHYCSQEFSVEGNVPVNTGALMTTTAYFFVYLQTFF